MEQRPANKKVFLACAVPGLAVMGFGVYGLFHNSSQTRPIEWGKWFLGGLLVHDFLIAPLVFLVAVLLVSRVPPRWKAAVQGGLIASGIVVLATWPYVAGYGRKPDNTTLLPNNYTAGLFAVLVVIWIVVVAWALWRRRSEPR